MLLFETLRTAVRALLANRLRSVLTTLGVIIGVGAVVAMLAIGEGARASVEGHIRSLGSNLLTIRPGAPTRGPVRMGTVETLSAEDAEAIAGLDGVALVSPEAQGSAQVRRYESNMTSTVVGSTPEYLPIHSYDLAEGVAFSELDLQGRRRVAVIGSNVAETLFGNERALGERIQLNGISFRVVGVLAEKGDAGFFAPDDQVVVPLTTHQGVLFGGSHVSSVSVQVENEDRMDAVQADIERLLRIRHRLAPGADDDFHVRSQAEMLETMGQVTGTFTALLGGVAAVSLLVGGIGIMNIMLVSVRERTREIGIRIAVGARRRDILLQFLTESVIVSVAGGLVGLAAGYGGAALLGAFAGFETAVPGYAVALSLTTSLAVGIVFGVGPARRAASLDPVEALRYE